MILAPPIAESLAAVRRNIDRAARRAGRDPSQVTLIAVSKAFPVDAIEEARRAGQMHFGENRVQELSAKASEIGSGLRWHFVGRLQRNKVKQVLDTGAVIHSVDRPVLADEISRRAAGPIQVLAEVNLTGEEQKGGVEPADLPALVRHVL
ncbi:MAG TPA: alanine racemase, partial [Actinomycetota bacterium]|nr:alanine racemase [Actinomycetota bacterium]